MPHAFRALVFLPALLLSACSGVQRTVDGWFAGETSAGSVYFAGRDGLAVHADASGASPVVGQLALHEKVVRSKLRSGYAYVVAADRDLAGWVDNAQLIWRLTGSPEPAGAAPSGTQEASPPSAGTDADADADATATSSGAGSDSTDGPPTPETTAPPSDGSPPASADAPAGSPPSNQPTPDIFDPF